MGKVKIFNQEKVSKQQAATYKVRKSVRIIILNNKNKIAILYSPIGNYYLLPGGGVEDGETKEVAALRESEEEVNCKILIISVLGKTKEYRKETKKINSSVGYLARKIDSNQSVSGSNSDTVEERGSVVKWVAIDEAIKLLKNTKLLTKNLYNKYSHLRDIYFLSKCMHYLNQTNI